MHSHPWKTGFGWRDLRRWKVKSFFTWVVKELYGLLVKINQWQNIVGILVSPYSLQRLKP